MRKRRKKGLIGTRKFGGFTVSAYRGEKVRDCWVEVGSDSDELYMRFGVSSPVYAYAAGCLDSGDDEALEAWLYLCVASDMYTCTDREFATDIMEAVMRCSERLESRGAAAAAAVTGNDEAENDAYMRDAIGYAELGESGREARREEMRDELQGVIADMEK